MTIDLTTTTQNLDKQNLCIANGKLFGRFTPSENAQDSKFLSGQLQLKGGITIEATLQARLLKKLSASSDGNIDVNTIDFDRAYLWRIYPRVNKVGELDKITLFDRSVIEGKTTLRHVPPAELGIDTFNLQGYISKVFSRFIVVKIVRNSKPPKGRENSLLWRPFWLTASYKGPWKFNVGDFWQLHCSRQDKRLSIEQAVLLSPSPTSSKKAPPKTKNRDAIAQTPDIIVTSDDSSIASQKIEGCDTLAEEIQSDV